MTHREMFSLTILLPGQETPIHYDTPYFKRISRATAPVWLLVALKQSGLWADQEIRHTQAPFQSFFCAFCANFNG